VALCPAGIAGGAVFMAVFLALAGNARAQQAQQPGQPVPDIAPGADDEKKAWFENTTEAQRKRAREIFLEGNRLIYVPAFAEAAQKYQEAIEIWENPAFYYNLAIAQINLLQPTAAYQSLQKSLRYGPTPLGQDKYERALEYMKSLEAQLARVRITCKQPDVEVSLDGRMLFVGPGTYEAVVQPGAHQLVASKEGYLTESRQLVGTPGQESQVDIRLRLAAQVQTARRFAVWKPWAVVAGSAVLLGGAAYLDFKTSSEFDEFDTAFDSRCPVGCVDAQLPEQFTNQLSQARTQQDIALVTYAVGGALLATGAVLLYLNRERVIRINDDSDSSPLSLTPVITTEGAGLSAGIRF
jgi:tetratricopeptide (TPR) repeat protein